MNWVPIAVGVGAIFGALSRYYLTLFWLQKYGDQFPYGTFFVNLTGAFLIGFISVVASHYSFPMATQKFILVGFLGAYTTFSSYILDSFKLFRKPGILMAIAYWIGSPILGFFCVELGIWLGQRLVEIY